MNYYDFKVGMKVSSYSYPNQIGVVTHLDEDDKSITFKWNESRGWRNTCKKQDTFNDMYIYSEHNKTSRVSLKIKLLWNNSNYAMKNPQVKY